MRVLDKVRLRFRSLLRRDKVERELAEELHFHLDQLTEENIAAGMAPDDARVSARRSIGDLAQYQEQCRDMRQMNIIEDFGGISGTQRARCDGLRALRWSQC